MVALVLVGMGSKTFLLYLKVLQHTQNPLSEEALVGDSS